MLGALPRSPEQPPYVMGYVIPALSQLLIHAEISGCFLSLHTSASAGPSAISMSYPEFDPDGYREDLQTLHEICGIIWVYVSVL